MKLKAQFDFSGIDTVFWKLQEAMQNRIMKNAAEAGGKKILAAYRALIPEAVRTGTFVSGRGTPQEQVQHFQHLIDSVDVKTRMFKDKTGAYAIVGVTSAPGTRKPEAPQGGWGEEGTAERYHKDGSPTGRMPRTGVPYKWLAKAVESSAVDAQNTAIAVIESEVNRVLGN